MSVIDRAKKYVENHEKIPDREERDDRKPSKVKKSFKHQFESTKKELSPERIDQIERISRDFNKNVVCF